MRRLPASGAIGMLITMVIIAIMFMLMMPTLKDAGTGGIYGSSLDKKSVEERVNSQVEEIERMRQQTIQYNKNQQDY